MSQFGGIAVDAAPPASRFGGKPVGGIDAAISAASRPQSKGDGIEANVLAGAGEGITGVEDLATMLPGMPQNVLHALHGLNSDIPDAPTGHDINTLLGKIDPSLNPENTVAGTSGERIARHVGTGLTALAVPEGGGGLTLARAAANTILGGLGGLGAGIASESVPEQFKPAAEFVGGVAGSVSPQAFRGFIAPKLSKNVETLLKEGVNLTPGQIGSGMGILGRTAKGVEDALTSIPFVGDIVKSAHRRALTDFNTAAINRALEPIKEVLPKNLKAGRDAVTYAGDRLSAAYDKILPQLKIARDPTFTGDVAAILQSMRTLPQGTQDQFHAILKDVVFDKFGANGAMAGRDFKSAEAELSRLSRKYSGHNATPNEQEMADHISDLREDLHALIERMNPSIAPTIRAINTGYAALTRIERAAGSTGAVDGLFTAPQLQSAVRGLDRSSRRRAFARGNALMQDLSDAGRDVLPSSIPDSGTPRRAITAAAALGGGAELFGHLDPYSAAGLAAAMGLYTPVGTKAAEYAMTRRPYNVQSAGQLVDDLSRSWPAAAAANSVAPAAAVQHGRYRQNGATVEYLAPGATQWVPVR